MTRIPPQTRLIPPRHRADPLDGAMPAASPIHGRLLPHSLRSAPTFRPSQEATA